MNKILYVVLNKELNMSAGKSAAQAVHAAMTLQNSAIEFADEYKRTVIVLEAKTEQLRNLEEYLDNAGIFCGHYVDEGHNEVEAYSLTALAVEPIWEEDTERREIFKPFKLFGSDDYDDDEYDDCDRVEVYKPETEGQKTLRRIEYTLGQINNAVTPVPKTKRPNIIKRFFMRKRRRAFFS